MTMHAELFPTDIQARTVSRVLELRFSDGQHFVLPFEYLRVYSPSAEVRGHGEGQEVLQTGKRAVNVEGVEPVGHYAIRLLFSDGHQSGLYTWAYLHQLGSEQTSRWARYLERLQAAGFPGETGRDAPMTPPAAPGCGKSCAH